MTNTATTPDTPDTPDDAAEETPRATPIQRRSEAPSGFVICEDTDSGKYMGVRKDNPGIHSAWHVRRYSAVKWCWEQLGRDAAAQHTSS